MRHTDTQFFGLLIMDFSVMNALATRERKMSQAMGGDGQRSTRVSAVTWRHWRRIKLKRLE